jgi:hydrogenase maturation protein HypF
MGRLFDAVAALIGVRQQVTYEGQAAVELEVISAADESGSYPYLIDGGIVDLHPTMNALLSDWSAGIPNATIGGRFHNFVADLAVEACQILRSETGVAAVALSGGVWQNMLLFNKTVPRLTALGFHVLCHRQLPANDGCISLGQVLVADWLARTGKI